MWQKEKCWFPRFYCNGLFAYAALTCLGQPCRITSVGCAFTEWSWWEMPTLVLNCINPKNEISFRWLLNKTNWCLVQRKKIRSVMGDCTWKFSQMRLTVNAKPWPGVERPISAMRNCVDDWIIPDHPLGERERKMIQMKISSELLGLRRPTSS